LEPHGNFLGSYEKSDFCKTYHMHRNKTVYNSDFENHDTKTNNGK